MPPSGFPGGETLAKVLLRNAVRVGAHMGIGAGEWKGLARALMVG
jgi:hypothetical protein